MDRFNSTSVEQDTLGRGRLATIDVCLRRTVSSRMTMASKSGYSRLFQCSEP